MRAGVGGLDERAAQGTENGACRGCILDREQNPMLTGAQFANQLEVGQNVAPPRAALPGEKNVGHS